MKEIFTTFEISHLCNVDITTVINWINSGKLLAYKTPGGHRRVKRQDFVKFIEKYQFPMPKELEAEAPIVLIVDDDEEIRKLIHRLLKNKWPDMLIYEAEDGFAAGKLLADKMPTLVILDIKLPGIDGIQVCQLIRDDNRIKDTKIFIITGYYSNDSKQKILKAGANDYMVKPFSPNKFLLHVERLISS